MANGIGATIPFGEVDYRWLAGRNNWGLIVDGKEMPPQTIWECRSSFGSIIPVVVPDAQGNPGFVRPGYAEAENVNLVVYGVDRSGEVKFAVIRQPRPHAENPEKPESKTPVVFGQIVMGFLNKVIGEDLIARYEDVRSGSIRETAEESGAMVVLDIEYPNYPWHEPNPTFVFTWSNLAFVKIDLDAVEEIKADRNEPIFSAEWISAGELIGRIAAGKDEEGAVYRMCTANSAWMIFFATHPELFPR